MIPNNYSFCNEEAMTHGAKIREMMLEKIVEYMMINGFPPSTREIGALVGLKSTSSVQAHLDKMEKLGMIEKLMDQPRTIRVPGIRYVDERKKERD